MSSKLVCPIHKKYRGNKIPTNQCTHCLHIYMTLKGRRIPTPPPSKVIPDKTKYTRKPKHKKEDF